MNYIESESENEEGSENENDEEEIVNESESENEDGSDEEETEKENEEGSDEEEAEKENEEGSDEEETEKENEEGSDEEETEKENEEESESENENKSEYENEEQSENENEVESESDEEETESEKETRKKENQIFIEENESENKHQIESKSNHSINHDSLLHNFTTFVLKNSYFLFQFQHRKRALFYRELYNHGLIDRSKINLFPFKSDSGLFYQTGKKEVDSNPDNISKILRNDDVDSLIQIFNEDSNFDINSIVKDSTFETCELNEQVSYLCYCAFYGSFKCFDFLLSNKANFSSDLVLFAVAGGNVHIIHQCEYIDLDFKKNEVLVVAIQYHQNDVCDWLIETKFNNDEKLIDFIQLEEVCLNCCNFDMFFKFVEKGFLASYFFRFIAKFKIKIFYQWMKECKLFFLIKYEITDHIRCLINHYERNEDEIIEIFEIIIEMIPDLPKDAVDLLRSDKKYDKLFLIYQKFNN